MNGITPLMIFDLDGTLVDTLEDLAGSANYALRQCGFPARRPEDYRYFAGNGARMLIQRVLPMEERNEETIQRVRTIYDARYAEHFLDHSAPYAGIPETLHALSAHGIRLAVVSNKPHVYTCAIVQALFGNLIFSALGHREGVPHKPDPAAVKETVALAGSDAQHTVYVGDSDVDVFTGRSAGLPVIGCAWGFRGEDELRQAGADRIARAPQDLLKMVEEGYFAGIQC